MPPQGFIIDPPAPVILMSLSHFLEESQCAVNLTGPSSFTGDD
jgi:hypothetical protein